MIIDASGNWKVSFQLTVRQPSNPVHTTQTTLPPRQRCPIGRAQQPLSARATGTPYGRMMQIGPATQADIDQLIESTDSPAAQHHIRGRWNTQQKGDGTYLLARRAGVIVGQTVLLKRSKYAELQAAENPAEINGLDAFIRNQGIGTALIRAAEALARDWGQAWIGLGVVPDNEGARRLYERLGYHLWPGPRVIDHWTEQAADGTVVRAHADECDYLLKPL